MVELAGRCGLDFVSFDAQHDPLTPAEIGEMCRIADPYGMTVSMRIPDGAESTILSYLDRGVRVITIPNLLTGEQAKELGSCQGDRSIQPVHRLRALPLEPKHDLATLHPGPLVAAAYLRGQVLDCLPAELYQTLVHPQFQPQHPSGAAGSALGAAGQLDVVNEMSHQFLIHV